MNWDEIKEKCPKSWKRFEYWITKNELVEDIEFEESADTLRDGFIFNWKVSDHRFYTEQDIRALYDFFDEQGIYITVEFNMFFHFNWKLITKPEMDAASYSDYDYKIRTEAEEKAFTKAFEILESKL